MAPLPYRQACWALLEGATRPLLCCGRGGGPSPEGPYQDHPPRLAGHWRVATMGRGPRSAVLPGRLSLEDLQIEVVDNFSLVVLGGVRTRDPSILTVTDGDLLEVILRKTDQLSPSSSGSPGPSLGSDDADGDGQPDSADFSSGSTPPGAGPHGPPPPEPVNRPRSRSPYGRTWTPADDGTSPSTPISIFEALPAPVFDLTANRLPFPHSEENTRRLLCQWPTSWMQYDTASVKLKETTRQALQQAPTWQQLFSQCQQGEPVSFRLFTDGSADSSPKSSGYCVVILIQVGALVSFCCWLLERLDICLALCFELCCRKGALLCCRVLWEYIRR